MKAVEIIIPPDKSISHRAIMLASISEGVTRIKNLLMAKDIKRTIEAFRAMGVNIDVVGAGFSLRKRNLPVSPRIVEASRGGKVAFTSSSNSIIIHGVGMRGLQKPVAPLYLGNSGTTMRILPGILAGQDFEVILTGDKSLSSRPMGRIAEPLKKMGAAISGSRLKAQGSRLTDIRPPLKIRGGKLKSINYKSKISSAQVKSCILFAGLYADGVTSVSEPEKSRDHTERMLGMFGCRLKAQGSRVSIKGPVKLKSPGIIEIPGDISSAAFFMVAGCILPGIKIKIKSVGLNSTRTGILDILKRMGADIDFEKLTKVLDEPAGDIIVKSSKLKGVTISPKEVVRAIDEIPAIMVAACFAKGKTVIKGIEELRIKETDRIKSMVTNLRKIGADIRLEARGSRFEAKKSQPSAFSLQPVSEVIVINGGKLLHGAKVSSFGDHRTAMSMFVAGLGTKGKVMVTDIGCINKSFPGFERLLCRMTSKGSPQSL